MVEGMECAIGIGRMIKGSDEMYLFSSNQLNIHSLRERSGSVIESLHILNDGLWRMLRGFPPTK